MLDMIDHFSISSIDAEDKITLHIMADIYFIDVVPKYRKRGLAKEFMKVAEDYAKERGAVAITVSFNQEKIADRIKDYTKYEYKLIKSVR